jgi:GNAT superfamily N-acetyltransferase
MDSDREPTAQAVQIRAIAEPDIERVTDMMARAFDDDPVVNHLAKQDGQREGRVRRFLRLALVPLTFPFGETYVTGGFEGAAYWNPPNQRPHGFWNDLRLLPHLIRVTGVAGLPRAIRCLDLLERKHPGAPHHYLFTLAVEPSMQGRGIGGRLMEPTLERCDREGVPAYLESTNERNVPLYERHGFRVLDEVALPDAGPTLWRMWREPDE